MKKKTRIWFYLIPIIGILYMLTSSCENDDNNNNQAVTITDIDGNVYHTVTIGTQVWMVENLKTTRYRNGDAIQDGTSPELWVFGITGAYRMYDNDVSNSHTYGLLYNWYAVNDPRNICPAGWHVPTDPEWNTLVTYLGGDNVAGGKLKETGTTHWISPNIGATNSSGFTALPGGRAICDATFDYLGERGEWWCAMECDAGNAWYIGLIYLSGFIYKDYNTKKNGFSVRCLKD
jgi:uncharacterized protein (TIGR02145 family)